jgi:hypothetical protein
MADSKISALAQATALTGVEVTPLVQGGATVKGSVQQLATAITGATGTNGETVTTSKPRVDLTQTWNNVDTTFTGVKFNVTDTASAAGSLLLDLQSGGVSRCSVRKDGFLTTSNGFDTPGNILSRIQPDNTGVWISSSNIVLSSAVRLRWTGGNISSAFDPSIYRTGPSQIGIGGSLLLTSFLQFPNSTVLNSDGSHQLAQRNGVNAQTFRLYGTFTDASNSRRLALGMTTGGVATIKPEGLGTGASGNVLHISGLPDSNPGPGILWNDAGTVKVGT